MADIPRDMAQLVKELTNLRVEGTEDLRRGTEMARALCMDVGEVLDIFEYEIRSAIGWHDRGNSRRARVITRPLRQAQTMMTLAARRCVAVYKTYLKQFADDMARSRNKGQRRFDPEK